MMTKLIQKNERNDSPAGNFDSRVGLTHFENLNHEGHEEHEENEEKKIKN